jgi:hypothetical protein
LLSNSNTFSSNSKGDFALRPLYDKDEIQTSRGSFSVTSFDISEFNANVAEPVAPKPVASTDFFMKLRLDVGNFILVMI